MNQDDIITRLRAIVEMTCMTSTAFSKRAGIDSSNFKKMLDGSQTITKQTLKKISEAYNVSLAWLLTGEGEMRQINNSIKTNGDFSPASMNGNISVQGTDVLLVERVKHLEELLAEKERLIKVYEKMMEDK